jgi:hypothetical protein
MATVRRHLRLLATAWILFQATSLSALVPRACCLAHQAAAPTTMAECHEQSTAMHPMHGNTHNHAAASNSKPLDECAIRGTCAGPLSALFAIFSTQGVLTDSFKSLPDVQSTSAASVVADQSIPLFTSPDAPPPRA